MIADSFPVWVQLVFWLIGVGVFAGLALVWLGMRRTSGWIHRRWGSGRADRSRLD
jgi:hypothetical protein